MKLLKPTLIFTALFAMSPLAMAQETAVAGSSNTGVDKLIVLQAADGIGTPKSNADVRNLEAQPTVTESEVGGPPILSPAETQGMINIAAQTGLVQPV